MLILTCLSQALGLVNKYKSRYTEYGKLQTHALITAA